MESFSTAIDPATTDRVRALANRRASADDTDPCAHGDATAVAELREQARVVTRTDTTP